MRVLVNPAAKLLESLDEGQRKAGGAECEALVAKLASPDSLLPELVVNAQARLIAS